VSLEVAALVVLAALLHASWNALLKGGTDVLLDTAAIVAGAALVVLPLVFIVPLPAAASWPYLAASVTIHLAYYLLMVGAYRSGDLSLVYPLMRGVAPLFTALIGIVALRELPTAAAWSGIALISAGVVLLALRSLAHLPSRQAMLLALANAGVIAAYTVVDGQGARLAGNAWGYIVWLFVLDLLPFGTYLWIKRGRELQQALWQRKRRGLVGGGLSAGAYAISVWAMTQAPVALVASLRETSVLFAALLGARMLREQLTMRRWLGAGAIVLGAVALKLA
jgi:drug/metabolite transporter (DMT)-like permease